jgi:Asp-tRNA(Asn)/Glu-tRNA(Gln) amidotransferase C subunit
VADLEDADVQALARLCRLALTDAQVAAHREGLAPVVRHLEALASADVAEVPARLADGCPLRDDDRPGACLAVDAALAGTSRRGDFVVVTRRR